MNDPAVLAAARDARTDRPWAGVRLSLFDRNRLADLLLRAVETRTELMVTYLNPFYARETAADPTLAEIVDGFDVVQPDGWGVVYGARLAGIDVPERAAIEDIERELFRPLAARGTGVFLFGSEPGIAEQAGRTLEREFPGLRVVGVQHGWLDVEAGHPGTLSEEDAQGVARDVASSGAEVVMVGLPLPLQHEWAARYGSGLGPPVVMTVGAYFDKLAEGIDWYPRWMLRLRLGWIYRVYREPRRLLKRYTVGSVSFGRLVARETLRARRRRRPLRP